MLAILVFGLQVLALLDSVVQAVSLPSQHPLEQMDSALPNLPQISGNTELKYCKDSRPSDMLLIERVDIYPQRRNDDYMLLIHIYGFFAGSIDDATLEYRYEYRGDPEIERGRIPFCEFIDRIDQPILNPSAKCASVAGWAHLSQEISNFQNWFIGGDWVFKFDAVNGDGMRIFCVEGEIPALTEIPDWQRDDEVVLSGDE